MNIKCGNNVGMSSELIKKLIIGMLFIHAFADETSTEGDKDVPTETPTINYEDLIAKARKEEKSKQYGVIEKLKAQVNSLTTQHNDDLIKIAGLEKQFEDAKEKLTKAKDGDSDDIKVFKEEIKTLRGEKETLEKEVADYKSKPPIKREDIEAEVRKELEAEYEVKTYKVTKLAELKDQILVPELVMGDTKEAIDASVKLALERSAEIRKSLGVSDKSNKRTPKTPANPSISNIQDTEISIERLATMDVRSPEYAEIRKQLGLR